MRVARRWQGGGPGSGWRSGTRGRWTQSYLPEQGLMRVKLHCRHPTQSSGAGPARPSRLTMRPPIPQPRRPLPARAPALLLCLAAALAGCGPSAPPAPPGAGMPPASVGVVTVQPTRLALEVELPGRLEAWRVAQVRARVPGIVTQRLFTEGSLVKAGQPLFQLDAAAYRATLASADAAVARADAGLAQAQAQVQRNQPLAEAKAISAQEWLVMQTSASRPRPNWPRRGRQPPRPASTSTTPRSRPRSPGASAARWSPRARWWARATPRSWP